MLLGVVYRPARDFVPDLRRSDDGGIAKMKRLVVCLALALFLCAEHAFSQLLEEVTVTAQKREQRAQDVSISISAFTGDQLQALGVKTAKDISTFTAGVEINEEYGNATTFTIRGINTNDFYATTSPAAAVYVDGIYKASNINSGSQIFDVQRIEILKGPQGTLYGRNVTGGAINVISRAPTDEWDGYLEASYGSFDRSVLEGAIGGPLTENLKFRVSAQWERDDGQFDNVTFPGQPDPRNGGGVANSALIPRGTLSGYESEIGGLDIAAMRAQFLFEPAADLTFHLRGHYSKDKSVNAGVTVLGVNGPNCGVNFVAGVVVGGTSFSPATCFDNTGFTDPDPYDDEISNDYTPTKSTEIYGASLTAEWETSLGKIISITGYEGFTRHGGIDADGSPNQVVSAIYNTRHNQFSEELRFESTAFDKLFYVLGFYYATDDIKNDHNDFNLKALAFGGSLGIFNDVVQETDHASVFGQAEYDVDDAWKLIAGLRLSYEKKDIFHEDKLGFPSPGVAVLATSEDPAVDNERISRDISYRVGMEWRPRDALLLFFNHARGIKSGGWNNAPQFAQADFTEFDEETLKSYEIGWKWDALDTLRFNGAIFHYDYKKPQSLVGIDTGAAIPSYRLLNLDSADQNGIELELTWAPLSGLELFASATFYDSEISSRDVNLDGNKLPFSPEHSFALLARYEWPIGDSLVMSLQSSVTYTGDHFPDAFNVFFEEQDYVNVGARISVGRDDRKWELSAWGKNLTDDIHIINSYGASNDARGIYLSEPLSGGVTFLYRFF